MTPGDIARVLAKAAAFDQRTVGEADVLAWHEALSDLDASDALAAVTRHYARDTARLMPAHVRAEARAVRDERRREQVHDVRALPSRFESDDDRADRVRRGIAACARALSVTRGLS